MHAYSIDGQLQLGDKRNITQMYLKYKTKGYNISYASFFFIT